MSPASNVGWWRLAVDARVAGEGRAAEGGEAKGRWKDYDAGVVRCGSAAELG